jgi:hypothetical protein
MRAKHESRSVQSAVGPKENISRPGPEQKRTWASVEADASRTIRQAFEEALRRDPKQKMRWVVVVDGNPDQMRIIRRLAKEIGSESHARARLHPRCRLHMEGILLFSPIRLRCGSSVGR